jgi:hypothetical protein
MHTCPSLQLYKHHVHKHVSPLHVRSLKRCSVASNVNLAAKLLGCSVAHVATCEPLPAAQNENMLFVLAWRHPPIDLIFSKTRFGRSAGRHRSPHPASRFLDHSLGRRFDHVLWFPVAPRVCYIWNLFGMAGAPRSRRSSLYSGPREGRSEALTSLLNNSCGLGLSHVPGASGTPGTSTEGSGVFPGGFVPRGEGEG